MAQARGQSRPTIDDQSNRNCGKSNLIIFHGTGPIAEMLKSAFEAGVLRGIALIQGRLTDEPGFDDWYGNSITVSDNDITITTGSNSGSPDRTSEAETVGAE